MAAIPASRDGGRSQLTVQHVLGSAAELHARPMPEGADPADLWVLRPNRPALVMGSSQREHTFDLARLRRDGVELATRRTGGGAVFLDPDQAIWIDVLAPRGGRDWRPDPGATFVAVGRRWQRALEQGGIGTSLCETAPERNEAARVACWAGVGWGELLIGDRKVLGLSQRRTRWGARVQGLLVLDGSFRRVLDYLGTGERTLAASALGGHADLAPLTEDRAGLEAAIVAELG